MNSGRATLITGIGGQDGWYLAERLLSLGQVVLGTTHRGDAADVCTIQGRQVPVLHLDLSDGDEIAEVIRTNRPAAVFNFAARASSAQLFDNPVATIDINGVAVARMLEAIRIHSPDTRFCQASSGEVFAGAQTSPQNELTLRSPINAYGAAKAFADHLVAAYRITHGLFACSAILYPHESRRRPPHFLVRKVCQAAARISAGLQESVTLGDLDAQRDWGYAPDYVEAMRLMLAGATPGDFVVATGEAHTVRDVCIAAFGYVGLDWERHVMVDDKFKRPPETAPRVGDAGMARAELGWAPSIGFRGLIEHLVQGDRAMLDNQPSGQKDVHVPNH